jgi:outer membrane receptor for ferrienterochelin and colicin
MKKLLFSIACVCYWIAPALAQNPLEQKVNLVLKNATLEEALYQLSGQAGVNLSFSNDILPKKNITLRLRRYRLSEALNILLRDTPVRYRVINSSIVALYKLDPPKTPAIIRFTLSGFLEDAESGEPLIGGNVYVVGSQRGATTNEYGFFSLTLPAGDVEIQFSYTGYESQAQRIALLSSQQVNIALKGLVSLPEVVIVASDSSEKARRLAWSDEILSIAEVQTLPALGGESDLIRTTHLLPGVQTGTDGVGGIHVRGGNPGQNLILIDGVPVYNISHAAGVFSIFNTNAVRSARFVKGGFPARYGGMLSSVLDVRTKEGNKKQLSGSAELGALSGRFSLEGPIQTDKSSFFISGRWSFLDWYIRPITEQQKRARRETGSNGYNFYDLNAKLNFTLSDADRIYLSYYQGSDEYDNFGRRSDRLTLLSQDGESVDYLFDQSYSEGLDWGNKVAALRWNHVFSSRLFANTTLTYTNLSVGVDYSTSDSLRLAANNQTLFRSFDFGRYRSGIEDVGAKIDFDLIPSTKHYFRFGMGITRHQFRPGILYYNDAGTGIPDSPEETGNAPIDAIEYAFYVEDEYTISDRFMVNAGLRLTGFSVRSRNYQSAEPRLSAYWQALPTLNFKSSFSVSKQYLHLLSNSDIGLPTDLWAPATSRVKPQSAWQAELGMDYVPGKNFSVSVEGYYKKMKNLLSFSEGALFLNDWERNVTVGEGQSYGIETLVNWRYGSKTKGWISYSLSWTDRQFEKVNLGRAYPFKFDRRHDLKIVLTHRLKPWCELSANWVLSSGFAFSLPLLQYRVEIPGVIPPPPIEVLDYGSKNQYRMPYYHRLDVGVNFYYRTGKLEHTANVGVYNLYDRRNPLYYTLRTKYINENNDLRPVKEFVQVWLIPILPSVNYSIKF